MQLQAELDLIRQQLEAEHEKMERCRRYLEPEEEVKLEESKKQFGAPDPAAVEGSSKS